MKSDATLGKPAEIVDETRVARGAVVLMSDLTSGFVRACMKPLYQMNPRVYREWVEQPRLRMERFWI